MKSSSSFLSKVTMCLFIIGSLFGAGILALPIPIGLAGLKPSIISMAALAVCMFISGTVLAREVTDSKDDLLHYPTLFGRYFGSTGKWVAISANSLVFHGLLVAYLAGAATVIVRYFGATSNNVLALISLFVILVCLILCGKQAVHRSNMLLVATMWIMFVVIMFFARKQVNYSNLSSVNWKFFPFSLPVILTAYWYHGIIPNVCKHLKWNFKDTLIVIGAAIILGSGMYLMWTTTAIGVIPVSGSSNTLTTAFRENLPATVPLQGLLHAKNTTLIISLFALSSLIAAYISLALGTIEFHKDLFRNAAKENARILILGSSFLPSFFIALTCPNIFLKAVNLVGGIGIAILYGILPCIIGVIRSRKDKNFWHLFACGAALIVFSAMLFWQILVECGVVKAIV